MLKPLQDRIIVKRVDETTMTEGGLHIPSVAQERRPEANVLAVGPGRQLESGALSKMTVEVGDTIILARYGGTEVEVDGEKVTIMREDEVLAIRPG